MTKPVISNPQIQTASFNFVFKADIGWFLLNNRVYLTFYSTHSIYSVTKCILFVCLMVRLLWTRETSAAGYPHVVTVIMHFMNHFNQVSRNHLNLHLRFFVLLVKDKYPLDIWGATNDFQTEKPQLQVYQALLLAFISNFNKAITWYIFV